nr:cell wall-binding repeat-containing protein [Clostridia bacterium]
DIINDQAAGNTVKISADDITLDLNQHKVGTTAAGSVSTKTSIISITGSDVRVKNGYLTGGTYVEGIIIYGKGKTAIENIRFWNALKEAVSVSQKKETASDVVVTNCVFMVNKKSSGYAIDCRGNARVILDEVTIYQENAGAAFFTMQASNAETEAYGQILLGAVTVEKEQLGSIFLTTDPTRNHPGDFLSPYADAKLDGQTLDRSKVMEEKTYGSTAYYSIAGKKFKTTLHSGTIPKVAVTFIEPEVGTVPDYLPTFQTPGYYSDVYNETVYYRNNVCWKDLTAGKFVNRYNGNCQRGHQYGVVFYLTAEPGYTFPESPEVTVNGEPATFVKRRSATELYVEYNFPVTQTPLYLATIYSTPKYYYTGTPIEQQDVRVTVPDGSGDPVELEEGTDYTLSYQNNIDVGTATMTITGIGAYSRSRDVTFEILPAEISNPGFATQVTGVKTAYTYTGKAIKPKPAVSVSLGGTRTTLTAGTDYKISYKNTTNAGTASVKITGMGNFTGSITKSYTIKPVSLSATATKTTVTGIKASYTETGKAIKPKPTVKAVVGGATKTLTAGTDYTVKYTNNTKPGKATVTITGKGNFTGSVKKTFTIKAKAVAKPEYVRLSGADRYATSLAIADAYKKELGVSKFDTICVADGVNFPDALAGAYFAYMNKAPIVVVHQQAPTGEKSMATIQYVKANLKPGGNVYILGGPGSVPEVVEQTLKSAGFKVERLWGMNRYGSNLDILKAAKIPACTDFIVTTGTDFADALTASATGKPVLLVVGNALTADQKSYLAGAGAKSFTIVGSNKEVSAAIASELATYAPVSRIAAASAYDRSIAVAKKYFPGTQTNINLADGRNFPDALCGGPLAAKKGGPLFLTDGSAAVNAKIQAYVQTAKTIKAVVYGGPASVADETVKYILSIN